MRTTGDFTVHNVKIEYDTYDKPIYLIPFGDVHKSSPMHDEERWQSFCDWGRTKKGAHFLGMGDYDDLASTSERMILTDRKLHESTFKTLEQLYLGNVKRFAKDIGFMKGRLLGLLGGNHYGEFQNGTTTDQKLCELMECRYLGVNSFLRVSFHNTKRPTSSMHLDIFAHHGRGGGRTQGASLNPVDMMSQTAEADIYLMGDNHQKAVSLKTRLRLMGACPTVLKQRKILLGRTGSFLKGYEEGSPSYIVDAQLPPTDLGVIKIEITPRRKVIGKIDDSYLDIHASI